MTGLEFTMTAVSWQTEDQQSTMQRGHGQEGARQVGQTATGSGEVSGLMPPRSRRVRAPRARGAQPLQAGAQAFFPKEL